MNLFNIFHTIYIKKIIYNIILECVTMIAEFVIAGFFIFAIGCFYIKQNYYDYEDTMKNHKSSYKPLLDDSFSDRVV